jgi:hypothetical protein
MKSAIPLRFVQVVVLRVPPKKNGKIGDLNTKAKQPLWVYRSYIFHSSIALTGYPYPLKE